MAKHYLIKAIHTELIHNFSYDQLCIICYDHPKLLSVYKQLPPYRLDKAALIDRLIWYADREDLLEILYSISLNEEGTQVDLPRPAEEMVEPIQTTRKVMPIKDDVSPSPVDLDEATRPSNPMTAPARSNQMTNNIQADKVNVIEAETVNIGGSIFG